MNLNKSLCFWYGQCNYYNIFFFSVPFAVEERSGVITVVDEIEKYDQTLFEFESLVTDAYDVTLVTNLTIHVVKLDSATVLDTR